MKLKQILENIDIIECTADLESEIGSICYDSRRVTDGALFVAITGFQSDGHRFIPMAMEKGATAVLCTESPSGDVPFVRVANTRLALALASKNFFGAPSDKMKMIGVTGTNGKTTSTLLIKHMLEEKLGAKVGLIGTNANMIGDVELHTERTTPESYELQKLFADMYEAGCTHVVMEVSSHSLTLDRVAGIEFETGIFTNLTQDHLDFHGTMAEYAKAKALLFSRTVGAAINLDDEYSALMVNSATCPVYSFSTVNESASLCAENIKLMPGSVEFTAKDDSGAVDCILHIPGKFSVYNALGVIACGRLLGLSLEECADALATAEGVKGRAETVPTDGDYTILIDYAHTPDALENILRTARETTKGRVVSLFGCGGDRDSKKRPIMGKIGTDLADFAIITSDNPRTEKPEAIVADIVAGVTVEETRYAVIVDRIKAIEYAIENHLPGDVIILAGKGHETYQEINGVKHHMDEREIVADILERRKER
ncbi:MAG: UDP-N-acetylmuramoyl-L-alanyl-D-glutamate--2,6-diaminopimelate ligase [Oscillospiraceae bacterium]|nr:UDP-N-acetylmuramoyl-L-alanyl-D-glutamate--2,6-diaminopimelate ligase [Oscillospiraceae bacterium]